MASEIHPVESSSQAESPAPAAQTDSSSACCHHDEPGFFDELKKIWNSLRTNPVYPEISYLLHWTDPIRTGLLFGIVNLAYFLVTCGEYSVVTLFNYCALALLVSAFAYANGLTLWAKYVQGIPAENPLSSRWSNSKLVVSRTVIEKHVESVHNFINVVLEVARDIYYCSFPFLSLKFALWFYTCGVVGKYFAGTTLIYSVLIVLFTWPRLYEEKKDDIDGLYRLVNEQVTVYARLVCSKLPKCNKHKKTQ